MKSISPGFQSKPTKQHGRSEAQNADKPAAAFHQTLRRHIEAPPLPLTRVCFFSPEFKDQKPPAILHLALLHSHPPIPPLPPPLQSHSRFLRDEGLQIHAGASRLERPLAPLQLYWISPSGNAYVPRNDLLWYKTRCDY